MFRFIPFVCAFSAFAAVVSPALADQNILHLAKTNVPGCMKFVEQTGKNWKALGMMGVSGSSCPGQFNGVLTVQAKMVDSHHVSLSNGMTCQFDDSGRGNCH